MKNTNKALFSSVVALILCCSMLVGSTFAWFTDSTSSAVNTIQAGNLDIVLEYSTDGGNTWADAEGKTLNFVAADGRTDILWEPGCTYVLPAIRVRNNGNLALKYEIVVSGVTGSAKLLEAIEFTANGNPLDTFSGHLDTNGAVSESIVIQGHMKEEAGNEYQGLKIEGIGITVYATQLMHESDSFGNQYDKDAEYAINVSTINELANALAIGENIILTDNITVTADNKLGTSYGFLTYYSSIDGGGKTITDDSTAKYAAIYAANVDYIKNLTVKTNSGYGIFAVAGDRDMSISNVTIEKSSQGAVIYSEKSTKNLILDNVHATGTGTATGGFAHAVVFATGPNGSSNITINSGTYTATDAKGYAVASFYGSVVTINGGTFTGNLITDGTGKIVIKGGTFNVDPSDYVADGHDVLNNGDGTYTVVEGIVVSTYDELVDAIKNGGKIVFANDITVDKWIMFSETLSIGSGQIITLDEINLTIDGNGHTLTVNAIESAGNGNNLFHSASNLNISNLTIKYADGLAGGSIGLESGIISNVNFVGGDVAVFPGNGDIKIENCTFATNATAIYFEEERDNLTVTGCTFNQPDGTNVILLRGDVKFTNNTINSGRTVNIVSGSPVVTGNNFNDVRLKVYSDATATISGNTINNLEFETTTYSSTFENNTLSTEAQAALNAVTKAN